MDQSSASVANRALPFQANCEFQPNFRHFPRGETPSKAAEFNCIFSIQYTEEYFLATKAKQYKSVRKLGALSECQGAVCELNLARSRLAKSNIPFLKQAWHSELKHQSLKFLPSQKPCLECQPFQNVPDLVRYLSSLSQNRFSFQLSLFTQLSIQSFLRLMGTQLNFQLIKNPCS